MKLFKLFTLSLVALPSVAFGMERGVIAYTPLLPRPVIQGLSSFDEKMQEALFVEKEFTYPDSAIFKSYRKTDSDSAIPVSITISDKQAEWLKTRHAQEPFVWYATAVDALRLYDKNSRQIVLDRCFSYGESGCCVIKECGTVLVACEEHASVYAKPVPGWRQRLGLFAARSALTAASLGIVLYTTIAIRQLISDVLCVATR